MKLKNNDMRFGSRVTDDYKPGDIETYILSEDELNKIRGGNYVQPPSKRGYLELKAKGMRDSLIQKEYQINNARLSQLKKQWDLVGVFGQGVDTVAVAQKLLDEMESQPPAPKPPEPMLAQQLEAAGIKISDSTLSMADSVPEPVAEPEQKAVAEQLEKARGTKIDPSLLTRVAAAPVIPAEQSVFVKILTEISELLERKDSDYGKSFSKLYQEFGMLSSVIRLSDKLERLKSLTHQDQKVLDESIDDSLRDLAGYCVLTLRERQGAK